MTRLNTDWLFLFGALLVGQAALAEELPPVTEQGERAMAAVDRTWAHLAEGEAESCLAGHLLPEDPKLLERLSETLSAQVELFEAGVIRIGAAYARVEGDWALVPIHVTMKRGEAVSHSVSESWAYREPGKEGEPATWKIVSEALMRDSRIKALRNDDSKALQEWWNEHAEQLLKLKPEAATNEQDGA
ncbi:MAG: hypothetical protein ACPGYV_05685 [Phycisphaeraceae bacterium]